MPKKKRHVRQVKRKKRLDRNGLREKLRHSRANGGELDVIHEEISDLYDLTLEELDSVSRTCQERTFEAARKLESLPPLPWEEDDL